MKYYLAIDIGASSGRHIIGWKEEGELKTQEVYRFPNGVHEENGHLVWDVDALFSEVKTASGKRRNCFLPSKACPLTPGVWTMCC